MKNTTKPENPLLNIAINILLPVMILNKGDHYVSPKYTLLIALCFPLIYGIQDYVRRGKKNYVSLIGIFNILLTGSLALMSLSGIWFAVKEASLPTVLGLIVFGSAFSKSPAAKMFFCNPQVLKMELIEERIKSLARELEYQNILKNTTMWLSGSFLISAIANFTLAFSIFTKIDTSLDSDAQLKILNEQLAHMTWMGYAVIALPLMVFSGVLVYNFLKRLSKLIEVPISELMNS